MTQGADVRSIEAIDQMRAALVRFGHDIREALHVAASGAQAAQEWITERVHHWQYQVRHWTEEVESARQALSLCEASGDDDHTPDCSREEAYLAQARRELVRAEEQLAVAQRWMKAIWEAAIEFEKESWKMRDTAAAAVDKGATELARYASALQGYAESTGSVGGFRLDPLKMEYVTIEDLRKGPFDREKLEAHTVERKAEDAQFAEQIRAAEARHERGIADQTAGADPISGTMGEGLNQFRDAFLQFLKHLSANKYGD